MKKLKTISGLKVQYGPWVPKPIIPPLAPKISEAAIEALERSPARLPRICAVVKLAMNAAEARDEILGL